MTSVELATMELERIRVLVVEDLFDNQLLVRRMLESRGATVAIARDGVEGFEMALAQEFDVILMDVQMPRMNGHEATQKLREAGYRKPILALTAHDLETERRLSSRVGYDEYLAKPIDRARLVRAISMLVGNQ